MPDPVTLQRSFSSPARLDRYSNDLQQEVEHGAGKIVSGTGTPGIVSRSASLDGRHPHTMPPRMAVLRWPNREVSEGHLSGSPSAGLVFHPLPKSGPLGERKSTWPALDVENLTLESFTEYMQNMQNMQNIALNESEPRDIEVVLAEETEAGDVPSVRPKLLDTVPGIPQEALETLANVASGVSEDGTDMYSRFELGLILSAALSSMESQCEDPAAVRHAKQAIDQGSCMIFLTLEQEVADGVHRRYSMSNAMESAEQIHRILQSLEEGGHRLWHVSQSKGEKAHALAISATRIEGGNVRLSVFNSNGWTTSLGEGLAPYSPAAFKIMPIADAAAALETFGDESMAPAENLPKPWLDLWEKSAAGTPLLSWLANAGPHGSAPLLSEQSMPPQKANDCAIEVQFAWLASVLPPADYKLVKAHTLNVLAQADGNSEKTLRRLHERITTSLSGYAVAQAPAGAEARAADVVL
ncbi:hypothetical protein [Acidovorax sp. SUPP3334]|uniref:hypothetical protein n=1 Tax=Acidovorax sp. SUPP3334 TaxID=2920881 RepID=UPI0023DE307A|nr:hypothetical protein [Acidovorax sp. SUPP3334]GKT21134.1 hypothetical protein AVHM3334_03720 [Acidovorax sp. SUPP3334]